MTGLDDRPAAILGGMGDQALLPRAAGGTVVLVEGVSDQAALEVLAVRRGADLAARGVEIVAMDGATNIARCLEHYGPHGLGLRVAGLYDVAEERYFRAGLERAGLGTGLGTGAGPAAGPDGLTREAMAERGFFVCDADLEDELIRAVGAERLVDLIEQEGGIRSFHTLQRQPALRDRSLHDQLRRLMGGRSGGKVKFARLMADAVALDRVPRPLAALLDHVGAEEAPAEETRAAR
jgi:hypothetical protein